MSKKRVLIVNSNMHIGGVQKALVNLLTAIHDKYDLTLLLFHPEGEYMKDIPKDVNVITVRTGYKYIGMLNYDVKGKPWRLFRRSIYAAITRFFGRNAAIRLMSLFQRKIKGYDVVISYLQNGSDKLFYGGCNDFVIRHTEAPLKVSVLHCDYKKSGADTEGNAKLYSHFDIIAACSEGCRASFVEALPDLADRTCVVRNCHNFDEIKRLSGEYPAGFSSDFINILSVARLGKEKGVLRAVKVISRLDEYKDKLRFYIIGDGVERAMIEKYIADEGLKDRVFMLGELANPYPYMRSCDLFLISSLSEAAPMVIGEAAYLGAPILSTRTSSADEMIEDTGFGWVCDNSEDALLDSLKKLLCSSELKDKREELKRSVLDNREALLQLDRIINQ